METRTKTGETHQGVTDKTDDAIVIESVDFMNALNDRCIILPFTVGFLSIMS